VVNGGAAAAVEPRPQDLQRHAAELETAPAVDILKWAADRFAPRLTFATSLGIEDCVITDLIGRHRLPIDLFTLDTGWLFPETYQLWRQLEKRYDITIRGVQPTWTVEEQAQHAGAELWKSNTTRCCELRELTPLRAALQGFTAWITA